MLDMTVVQLITDVGVLSTVIGYGLRIEHRLTRIETTLEVLTDTDIDAAHKNIAKFDRRRKPRPKE
jgi:hypothetical protein